MEQVNELLDKLTLLIDKVGVDDALWIVVVGTVCYCLSKRVIPWIGTNIVGLFKWVEPYLGRYFEAKLKRLETGPVALSPTANHSAALVEAAGKTS